MSIPFIADVDFNQNQIQNVSIQPLASNPPSPVVGQTYFNTVANELRTYDGTTWVAGSGGGSGDVNSIETSSIDSQVAIFSGTDGKTIKKSTLSGIIKQTAGVQETATAGTDFVTNDSAGTFTNKTFDVSGTGNTLSNVALGNFASGVVTTDLNVSATSSQLARADAIKTYVDGIANGSVVIKGALDASGVNTLPAGEKGDKYIIEVAGNFNGTTQNMQVGNAVVCLVDSTPVNTPANWAFLQTDLDPATEAVAGKVRLATDAEATAGTDDNTVMTPKKVKDNYRSKEPFAVDFVVAGWAGASAPFTLTYTAATHGRGANKNRSVDVYVDGVLATAGVIVANNGDITIEANNKVDGHVVID